MGITSRGWRRARRRGLFFAAAVIALLACGMPIGALARVTPMPAGSVAEQARLAVADDRNGIAATTRLEGDALGNTVDIQATPVPTDKRGQASAGPAIGLALAVLASTIALGIAFGIRRRIDRLVPPPDEEED
jgi:hypothetical protein